MHNTVFSVCYDMKRKFLWMIILEFVQYLTIIPQNSILFSVNSSYNYIQQYFIYQIERFHACFLILI